MSSTQKLPAPQLGVAKRHDDWEEITQISTIGRSSLQTIPNYRLIKAATRAQASPQARLLLVHLIGYLGVDHADDPKTRFVVFPGNGRLADELNYSKRSIQRLADELEAKGLLRRCYNGINRRTGFDLTPLAMQHHTIEASIVAIQTRRKAERERLQMELSLSADQVERPSRTSDLSSQDVAPVTHNRSTDQNSAESPIAHVLDSVSDEIKRNLCDCRNGDEDRTGDSQVRTEALILKHLSGSGRAAHLGWTLAKRTYGFERALALVAIAEEDPRRRATTERYFGWLLRMAMTGDGHSIISQAADRATNKVRAGANQPLQPDAVSSDVSPSIPANDGQQASSVAPNSDGVRAAPGEAPAMGQWRQIIRSEVGDSVYTRWLSRMRLEQHGDILTLTAPSPFSARYVEDNYGRMIQFAIQSAANTQDLTIKFRVA